MLPFASMMLGKAAAGGVTGGVGALVSRSTTAFSGTANAAISWETELYDNGGFFDAGSNTVLTVPTTGLYRVAAAIYGHADQIFTIWKNGAGFAGHATGWTSTSGDDDVSLATAIVSASAGDTFTLIKESTSLTGPVQAEGNWLGIEKIDGATQYALVSKAASQSISASTTATVTFTGSEIADVGGWFNSGTSTTNMVVPAGVTRIRLSASVITGSYNGYFAFWISKGDGTSVRGLPAHSQSFSGPKPMSIHSAILAVSPGDTFKVNVLSSAGSSISLDNRSWFCAEEVPDYARTLLYRSASLSVSGTTQVAMDHAQYDTAAAFNATNGTIVIPSGYSQVRFAFGVDAGASHPVIGWVANTSGLLRFAGGPEQETSSAISWINSFGMWIDAVAGQEFGLYLFSASFTLTDSNNTWLSAEFR